MSELEYFLEQDSTEQEAVFSFKGHFQHAPVTWHVHLMTCQSEVAQTPPHQQSNQQFIDIEKDRQEGHYQAKICLNIAKVNDAAILKTMIMLRQYKNLSEGRHEYSATIQAPLDK